MAPIKLKLTYMELVQLALYIHQAGQKAYDAQAREELIVLAEYSPVVQKRLVSHQAKDVRKSYAYTMPVSVARILHRRLQTEPIGDELQMVLSALDYELTRMNMKPDHRKWLFE